MKIDLLFPIFEDSNEFFKKLFASKFYGDNDEVVYYFYAKEGTSLDFLKDFPQNQKYVLRQTQDKFNFNDVFLDYLKLDSMCDVLLLGDTKVAGINKLFLKCLERKKEGINLVHIKCAKGKFRQFFSSLWEKFFNLFISIFTNKKEKFNIPTLGLIDSKLLAILKTLPQKACFLKNTNSFYGYEGRTLFIAPKTPHYKDNFWKTTTSLKIVVVSMCVNLLSIAGVVLGVVFNKSMLLASMLFLLVASFSSSLLFTSKHIIDVRASGLGAKFLDKNQEN